MPAVRQYADGGSAPKPPAFAALGQQDEKGVEADLSLPLWDVLDTLGLLLWRIGQCRQATRAPQQSSGVGDAVIAAVSPLL